LAKDPKTVILENAQKLTAKGQIFEAVKEWGKLLDGGTNDGTIHNKIGDIYIKSNQINDAISAYVKAAEIFRESGFDIKSIALYKKIVAIDPARLDIYERLADIQSERGFIGEAITFLTKVARHHTQRGNLQAALPVYRKLTVLDPQNPTLHLEAAEVCQNLGSQEEMIEAYEQAIAIYESRHAETDIMAVRQKILKINPDYSNRSPRKMDHAVPISRSRKQATQKTDRSVAELAITSEGLVVASTPFIELPKIEKPEQILSAPIEPTDQEVAPPPPPPPDETSLPVEAGTPVESVEAMVLEVNPVVDQILSEDLVVEAGTPVESVEAMVLEANPVVDQILSEDLVEDVDSIGAIEPEIPDAVVCEEMAKVVDENIENGVDDVTEASILPVVSDQEFCPELPEPIVQPERVFEAISEQTIEAHFTEVEIFYKYGLTNQAIERLLYLVEMVPDNELVYSKLKTIYFEHGLIEQAAQAGSMLADLYHRLGEIGKEKEILKGLLEIDPAGAYRNPLDTKRNGICVERADTLSNSLPTPETPEKVFLGDHGITVEQRITLAQEAIEVTDLPVTYHPPEETREEEAIEKTPPIEATSQKTKPLDIKKQIKKKPRVSYV